MAKDGRISFSEIMLAAMECGWINLGDGGTLYDQKGEAILTGSGLVLPLDELLAELGYRD